MLVVEIQATPDLGLDEALLLHQGGTLGLFLLALSYTAAQDLDLLHHSHGMTGVACSERQLLQKDSLRKPGAWLKARSKIEVQADEGMVPILVVGSVLDGQDVEGDHNTVNRYQH